MRILKDERFIKQAQEAVQPLIDEAGGVISRAAERFSFSQTSLWQLMKHGTLYPAVARELERHGLITIPKARFRRAATFTNQQRLDQFDAMMDDMNTNLTELLNKMLDEWLEEDSNA